MLKVIIDYPKQEEEKLIIRQNINGEKFNVKPILKAEEIIEARGDPPNPIISFNSFKSYFSG